VSARTPVQPDEPVPTLWRLNKWLIALALIVGGLKDTF
jgi:hypothetical protein